MCFADSFITNIPVTALPGTEAGMQTDLNSSQILAEAQEGMVEQQPASTAGGVAVNDETNQGRLEQLVDGIAHLQHFFFLESSFINHSTRRRPVLARRPPQGP